MAALHTRFRRASALGARGNTLIEVVVTLSLFATLAAIAIPRVRPQTMNITATQRLLIAKLRLARTDAISKSVHFKVSFPSATQVQVSRLIENPAGSGIWEPDTSSPAQTTNLPAATSVNATLVGTSVEFNSRGIALNLTGPWQVDALDTFGVGKSLQVWPSGQVNEL